MYTCFVIHAFLWLMHVSILNYTNFYREKNKVIFHFVLHNKVSNSTNIKDCEKSTY